MNKAIEILVDKPHLKRLERSDEAHKTRVSGIERNEEYKFKSILPHRFFVLFSKIQRLFYNTDFGIGYVVMRIKSKKRQMAKIVINWVYAKRYPVDRTILRHL